MVKVDTTNMEDKCAVDLVNTLIKLQSVRNGNTEREIKVIGSFNNDIILSGIIDQVQYCPSDGSMIILELKTRQTATLPEYQQRQSNHLQVMIYKQLLDPLTQGHHKNYSDILQQQGLRVTLPLSKGPVDYIKSNELIDSTATTITLHKLSSIVTKAIVDLRLPVVNTLLVQYISQADRIVLGIEPVLYDLEWTSKMVKSAIEYWKGDREAVGVDIEDSWKCQHCSFNDVCFWRKKQVSEASPVKKWPQEFYHSPVAKKLS